MKVKTYRDPLILAIEIVQDRTKALILWEMEKSKREASAFFTNIPTISKETIMQELAVLIDLGLVSRLVHERKKQQYIEYALSNRGAQLLKCLRKMMSVGIEIMMEHGMEDYLEQDGYIVKLEEEEEIYDDPDIEEISEEDYS